MDRGRKVRWVVGSVLAVVALGLLACGVGGYLYGTSYWDFGKASAQLDDAVAKARSVGLPMEASELKPATPVAPQDNAAPILDQIKAKLDALSEEDQGLKALRKDVDGWDLAYLGTDLKAYEGILTLAQAAASKRGLDFELDWDDPERVAPIGALAKAVKLLCYRAEARAFRKDDAGALEDLRRAQHLAQLAGEPPCELIQPLMQTSCNVYLYYAVSVVAQCWAKDAARLRKLEQLLRGPALVPELRPAVRGEVYRSVASFRNFEVLGGLSGLDRGTPEGLDKSKLRKRGQPVASIARGFLARELQAGVDIDRILSSGASPVEMAQSLEKLHKRYLDERGMSYRRVVDTVAVFAHAASDGVEDLARSRIALALVRAMEFRATHGRAPKSLAEAGDNGVDPFDGKPLRLKVEGDSIRVYSVGKDLVDDGGFTKTENHDARTWDIAEACPPIVHPVKREYSEE